MTPTRTPTRPQRRDGGWQAGGRYWPDHIVQPALLALLGEHLDRTTPTGGTKR